MIAQVYGITTLEDACACVAAGADHIGILPPVSGGPDNLPGLLDKKTAEAIFEALRGKCKIIALSESNDPEVYIRLAEKYHPDIIHIAAQVFTSNRSFREKIREIDPNVLIMQCVPVGNDVEAAVSLAKERAEYADFLITDTIREGGAVGASGMTHSWEADKAIVERVTIPVILAGGIGPENAAEIAGLIPAAGLDSLTKTNIRGTMNKDIEKVRYFCEVCHRF